MGYEEENIREEKNIDYNSWYKQYSDSLLFKKRRILPVTVREKIDTSESEKIFQKASITTRHAIFLHLNTQNHQYLKLLVEGPARGKEQVYRWLPSGLEEAKSWLENKKVKNPEVRPEQRNTKDLTKEVTAIWLMSYYHGKKLDEILNKREFTIPLIAQRLAYLKY